MSEVTRILGKIESGAPDAAGELLPLVYEELRRLAAAKMAKEVPGHTLQATALVHEAYLRLVKPFEQQHWDSRGHFFAAAAEAMRRILIDIARKKHRVRHGGDQKRVDLDSAIETSSMSLSDLLAVDEALDKLASDSPERANLVKLRFYAGMSIPEAAEALNVSRATAERYWTYAKCWLYAALADSTPK